MKFENRQGLSDLAGLGGLMVGNVADRFQNNRGENTNELS